jgi:hypothetical protein
VLTTGNHRIDRHRASVLFCLENGTAWWLTCVYGLQGNNEKIAFLQELHDMRGNYNGPWVMARDFSLIYRDEYKNNSNYNRTMMGRFRRFIDDLALKKISLHGR